MDLGLCHPFDVLPVPFVRAFVRPDAFWSLKAVDGALNHDALGVVRCRLNTQDFGDLFSDRHRWQQERCGCVSAECL